MDFFKVLKKYLYFVTRNKTRYIFMLIFLVLGTITVKSIPVFYGQLIDALNNQSIETAFNIGLILVTVRFIGGILYNLKDQLLFRISVEVARDGRIEYVQSLQKLDYTFHTNKSSGSLISIAKRGEGALDTALGEINNRAFEIIVEFTIAVIGVFSINQLAGAILLVDISIALFISYFLIKINIRRRKKANEEDDIITGITVDNLVGFETVKIFGKESEEINRFQKAYRGWIKAFRSYQDSFRLIDMSDVIWSTIGIGLTIFVMITQISSNSITIGQFVAAMGFIFGAYVGLSAIVYKFRDLAKTYTDLEKFFGVMEMKSLITDPSNPTKAKNIAGDIKFQNVSFSYPDHKYKVLNNINLEIKANEKIALVGKSGAGKTTFTRLLIRFFDPTEGKILIDDIDIKDLLQNDLRKLVSVVPQEPVLFNETIQYNIGYPREDVTFEEIKKASKDAHLDDFVNSLPKKYDTIVGERGIKLSGGQKQRLAIARAIVADPEIIIFDEATSQLDSETEKKVQDAFENLTQNKTTIIIAHRLSTVMKADRIIVFNKGEIAEDGTHAELTKNSRIYKLLWELQTDSYRPVDI